MSKFPQAPNSFSFSGQGYRVDFFTFSEKKVFQKLTVDGVDQSDLDDLISEMEEVFSETGGTVDRCSIEFDEGTEVLLDEASFTETSSVELPTGYKYLLIRTESVRGTFDAWSTDSDEFTESDISIEKEIVKLPGNDQLSLVHVTYQDDYGDGADYFGNEVSHQVFAFDGSCFDVVIKDD
jgi:hypothetical protein